MIPDSVDQIPVPVGSDESIFLATGGPERQGTVTYIGGGLFLGHNHGRVATDLDSNKTVIFGKGMDGEQSIVRNAFYHFSQEGHLEGASGSGSDIMLYRADIENPKIPAIPLLIMSDPTDLIGERTIVTKQGDPKSPDGIVLYATGEVNFNRDDFIGITNTVTGGTSGAGIFVQLDTDNDGVDESYIAGTVFTYTAGTTLSVDLYHRFADTLKAIAFDPDLLPRYTLMSGVDKDSSSHEVNGTFLHENIIGGTWNDTLSGGAGDDIFIGKAGSDVFVFASGDGNDVVRDYLAGEDSISVDNVLIPDFKFTQAGTDVQVLYERGANSISFENTTIADVKGKFPSYKLLQGTDTGADDQAVEIHVGTDADDIIFGGGGKDWYEAASNIGNDVFVGETDQDTVSYKMASEGVTLDLAANRGLSGSAVNDRWTEIEVFQTTKFDDTVHGSEGDDTVWLHDGTDTFYGKGGDDTLRATLGTNHYDGGEGFDLVVFIGKDGRDYDIYSQDDPRSSEGMSSYVAVEEFHADNGQNSIYIGSGTDFEIIDAKGGNDTLNIYANSGQFRGSNGTDAFIIKPDNLMSETTDIVIDDFNAVHESLTINDILIPLDEIGTAPSGFVYGETPDGSLTISFGDDDMVTLRGVEADFI